MTNTLIDPRPMEPAWVSEHEPTDVVSWTIRRRKWNKEARKMDVFSQGYSGTTEQLLESLVQTLKSGSYECDYDIDAEHAIGEIDDKPRHYSMDYPDGYHLGLDWSIVGQDCCGDDTGYCTDELMDWVEHYVNNNKRFTVSLWVADPTP